MIEFITNIFFINIFLCTLLAFDFCSVLFKMSIHYPLHLPWFQTVLTLFLVFFYYYLVGVDPSMLIFSHLQFCE